MATHMAPCERESFCLVSRRKGGQALPESRQSFEVAEARTFGLVNLAFSRQTGLRSASICLPEFKIFQDFKSFKIFLDS